MLNFRTEYCTSKIIVKLHLKIFQIQAKSSKMVDTDLAVKFCKTMEYTISSDERIKSFIQYLSEITPEFQGDDEL